MCTICTAGAQGSPDASGGDEAGLLARVFPDASEFGPSEGTPPAIAAYRGDRLAGYVFRTHEVVQSVGLSGKTLNIAVGLDMAGRITGAEIIEQHEPILAIGVSSQDLAAFVAKFAGRDAREPPLIVRRTPRSADQLAAVSGATVSSLLISDAIYQSARAVGQTQGLLAADASRIDLVSFEPADWRTLLRDESLAVLELDVASVEQALAKRGGRLYPAGVDPPRGDVRFLELVVGLATPARIGRNLLGPQLYNKLVGSLASGEQLVFIAANGLYSFKGTGYVRSGRFERIQLAQDERTIRFAAEDHLRVDRLRADGAPEFREMALYRIRPESGFDPARPWRLDVIVTGESDVGEVHAIHSLDYAIPRRYLTAAAVTPITPPSQALWRNVWLDRLPDVVLLSLLLGGLGTLFFLQDVVAGRPRLYRGMRYAVLGITLLWLGWYAAAQLSVLNVFTFAGALRTEFRWEFFLLEPLIFILWCYVAVALLFSGRGAFCGWLCPFGALQELSNRIGRRFRIPQLRVPFGLHERLWPLKYIVFLGLFAISLGSIDLAQTGSEIEPFKTAIVLRFVREWPFVVYALLLLGVGLFIERAFCRYLCPLGAALAIPARIRMFEWLKRRWHCGRQCNICATQCPVQAIHPNGTINPNECIYCLNCQTLYFDDTVCPPLIERRKRREMRTATVAIEGD